MFHRYFTELKSRTFLFLVASFFIFLVCYIFKEVLLNIIVTAYTTTSCSALMLSYFIFTDVAEVFNVYICLIFFVVKQVLFFYFFYHLFMFLVPSLTRTEHRFLIILFFTSGILFLLSVVLFHKLIFPFSWSFFLSFKDFVVFKSLTLYFEAKLLDYITFFFNLYFSCVFYFQFFLFPIFFFFYFGNELSVYRVFRKFLYYACILFSTIVTPPDVTSQVVLSFMFIVGCEILVYCSLIQKVIKHKD